MAVRSFKDQIESLLSRRVAQHRVAGVPSSDAEASALLESLAFGLLLKPKTVLYFAHLARNGLVKVLNEEIEAAEALITTIGDLGNPTYKITGLQHLRNARNSLLQIENLDKVDVLAGAYKRYDKGINDFLNKSLAKSVRRPGSSEMTRTGEEAKLDLPADFAALRDKHTDLLGRLYALAVGVQNFLEVPLGAILGINTASKARSDIEDVISEIESELPGSARDIAVRLLGGRASVRAIGTPPYLYDPLISTSRSLPSGYAVKGVSDPVAASATSLAGPFSLPTGSSFTLNGVTTVFPQVSPQIDNEAVVVSEAVTYPVVVAPGKSLFIQVDYTSGADAERFRVNLNTTAGSVSKTLVAVLADINAALSGECEAAEYLGAGTSRILIKSLPGRSRITVLSEFTEPSPTSDPGGVPNYFNDSFHEELGFEVGQSGEEGSVPAFFVADAINFHFSSVEAETTVEEKVVVTSSSTAPAVRLDITAPSSLGLTGSHVATSKTFRLYGSVFGSAVDPVSPDPLVDVGDTVLCPNGFDSRIESVTSTRVVLEDAVQTFDGDVVVTSALDLAYLSLDGALQAWLPEFLKEQLSTGIKQIDAAVASVSGSATPAARNTAVALLRDDLLPKLTELLGILTDPGTLLPAGAAVEEKKIVEGIIEALTERKFDRAVDMLMKCKVQEFLLLDGQTASFSGDLMQSMSSLAQQDVLFPDPVQDQQDSISTKVPSAGEDV
jgi:hypothetical protein